MRLVENHPLDLAPLAGLLADKDDLFLVWPAARHPFDPDQWAAALDPAAGNRDFLVHLDDRLVGHAALRTTPEEGVWAVSCLYLRPECRDRGLGGQLMAALEDFARRKLGARRLVLRVRTYNPRARACYEKVGFRTCATEDTLVLMAKELAGTE